MASQEGGAKKLKELRVVDLRRELENRGLDKGGVKAVLTERLQKALEDEGEDPNEFVFEPGTDSPKRPNPTAVNTKKTTPRTGVKGKSKEDGDEEEMCEDSLLDEDLDLEDEIGNIDDADMELLESEMQVIDQDMGSSENEATEEMVAEEKTPGKKEDEKPAEPDTADKAPEKTAPAKTEEETPMETNEEAAVSVPAVKDVKPVPHVKEVKPVPKVKEVKPVPQVKEVKPVPPVKEVKPVPPVKEVKPVPQVKEVKPKEEAVKTTAAPQVTPVGEKAAVTVVKKEDVGAPPDPSSVIPLVPLTVEDKIQMDTSQALQTEENESLDVHVDDTQNDLDADLLSSGKADQEKKEAAVTDVKVEEKKEEVKEEAVAETKEGETKVESVTPDTEAKEIPAVTPGKDTKAEKKPADKKEETDTSKPASSSTTAKSSTVSKDPKKDEKGSSGAGRNLWVSGLSSTTRATDLKALFSKHGKVVGAKVVTNARSPGSKCYGFVTMSTADEATKCIQHLHRTELHGKMISVERAKNEPGAQVKGATAAGSAPRKPDARSPADKKSTTTPRKDDRDKRDGDKKSDDKKDDKKDVKRDTRRDHKPSSRSDDRRPHSSSTRRDTHRRSSGPDRPRTVVMDKSKGEPVVRVRSRDRSSGRVSKSPSKAKSVTATDQKSPAAATATAAAAAAKPASTSGAAPAAKEGDAAKKEDTKDALSFDKIQEERERERLRQRERKLREEERIKKQEIEFEKRRQRDVHMKQRAEAIRLARERERLRKEREMLERERLETQRLERLRTEQMERERIEREREEKRRLEQLRMAEAEQRRAALKRTYESRGNRDNDWSQPKRANRLNDNDSRDKNTRDNRPNRDNANRFNDRGSASGASGGGNFERKVERYDRREVNRVQDNRTNDNRDNRSNDNRASGRQFEENRRTAGRVDNFRDDQRDDRRTDDRFARTYNDRNVNHAQTHDTANRTHDRNNIRDDRRDTGFNRNPTRDHVVRDDRRAVDMAPDDRRGGNVRDNPRDNRNMGAVGGHNMRVTSPRHTDNRADWKTDRDTRQQGDSRVVVRGPTNMAGAGRDSWQGGHSGGHSAAHGNYSNVVQDDRNRGGNKGFSAHNSGAGLLGNAPQSQNRQWGSGTDNRKMESTWTTHNTHSNMDQRVAPQQQDRWSGGVTMQQEARPTSFTQPVATSLISVPPNVYMTSVPQQSGMIIGNIATGRQPEPRFDAYKMQTGAIRRTY